MSFRTAQRPSCPLRRPVSAGLAHLALVLAFGCDQGEPAELPRASCEPTVEAGGSWRPLPDSGLGILPVGVTHVWTGTEWLVWGQPTAEDGDGRPISAGSYSPEAGAWRDVSAQGVLAGGAYAASVWTGSEWIVWGGRSAEEPPAGDQYAALGAGARFDPLTGEWQPMAESPLGRRFGHSAVWTGTEMLVWGGFDENGALGADDPYGAAYDPAEDSWRLLNAAGSPRVHLNPVWTGTHMLLWAALPEGTVGAKYDPERDQWSPLSTVRAPQPSGGSLWTGKELLAWSFVAGTWARHRGGAYDPATDTWRSVSVEGAPPSSREVWTGQRVLSFGDFGSCTLVGSYDPAEDRWERLDGPGAPSPRGEPALVWTGTSLLVWGGRSGESGEPVADGAEFVPEGL